MAKRQGGVQSVAKALKVLETVAFKGSIGSTELSRELGMHVATVHNILFELASQHYLINQNGTYSLGPAIPSLITHWDPHVALPDIAKPYMKNLSIETGEAITLAVLVGKAGRLVAFEPGTQAVTIHYPQWEWPDAIGLTTGRVLIALKFPKDRYDEFLGNRKSVEPDWDLKRWYNDFAFISRYGVGIMDTGENGNTGIAMPVYTKNNNVIASLGVSTPSFRMNRAHAKTILSAMIATIKEISKELGAEEGFLLPDESEFDGIISKHIND
jgi:DNA-binding IclR family transcriptional regulator